MSIEITLDTLPAYLRGAGHPDQADRIEKAGRGTPEITEALEATIDTLPDGEARAAVETLARVIGSAGQHPEVSDLRAEMEWAITNRATDIFDTPTNPGDGRFPHHPDNVRAGLIEAGARRQLADLLGRDASLDTADWVRAARQLTPPLSITEISRLTGATRKAVYRWIETNDEN